MISLDSNNPNTVILLSFPLETANVLRLEMRGGLTSKTYEPSEANGIIRLQRSLFFSKILKDDICAYMYLL